MTTKSLKLLLVFILVMGINATVCWAKSTAYGYLIAYSARDQVVYYTPIFKLQVAGKSFSDEEFFSDTLTVLKLEAAFQKYLTQTHNINPTNFTVSARDAYKSQEIALKRFNEESGTFRFRGFKLIEESDFKP
jgi:hypothetical protein